MSEEIDPPGTDRIQIAVAVKIFQPNTLPFFDGNNREILVVFHLCAGMPQNGEVTMGKNLIVHAKFLFKNPGLPWILIA
jgi:hypothetical protein